MPRTHGYFIFRRSATVLRGCGPTAATSPRQMTRSASPITGSTASRPEMTAIFDRVPLSPDPRMSLCRVRCPYAYYEIVWSIQGALAREREEMAPCIRVHCASAVAVPFSS